MSQIEENPIKLFDQWFKEAQKSGIAEPNAVNLATSTKDGKPSNRMVLMKGYDNDGFKFFTNLESQKGKQIEENPFVSMCFFWPTTDKQIRIEGQVNKVTDKEADEYFNSRPLNSRIGALVSKQSRTIECSDFSLFKNSAIDSFKLKAKKKIERPDYWSGFQLTPSRIEFWQRGEFRIHKRISYSKIGNNWETKFLYP
jgi:pyridoxamine 5'-phosphate oxidase